jgi:hypothetical protein
MKQLALLIVGVVVGWAASGVEWNHSAVGEETAKLATKSTDGVLTFELSDKPVNASVFNGALRTAGNPEDLDPLRRPAIKFSEPLFDTVPVSTNAANKRRD